MDTIFNAIREIGLIPVVVVLLLLSVFRNISRLEKQNDFLLKKIIGFLEAKK